MEPSGHTVVALGYEWSHQEMLLWRKGTIGASKRYCRGTRLPVGATRRHCNDTRVSVEPQGDTVGQSVPAESPGDTVVTLGYQWSRRDLL